MKLGKPELDERFEVLRQLGEGAFGKVYEVRDRGGGPPMALKILSSGDLEREGRELEVHLELEHPHVVRCHEGKVDESGGYLLLELCETSLLEVLRDPARLDEGWELLAQAAEGLAALHEKQLVHRDMKPGNVLVKDGKAKLADLGLIRGGNLETLTKTGLLVGTPTYMSPEQALGRKAGPATDAWALGIILYQLLERRLPYPDSNMIEQLTRVARAELLPLQRAPELLDEEALAMLRSLLAKEPEDRPGDMRGVAATMRAHPPELDARRADTLQLDGIVEAAALPSTASGKRVLPIRGRSPLLGLLALVGLAFLVSPGAEAPPPAPAAPFEDDYPAKLLSELAEAEDLRKEDGSELLDWDPYAWPEISTQLPELERFLDWIEDGGDPRSLPAPMIEQLREVGATYRRRRLIDPFHPVLHVEPLEPKPGKVGGWTGRALELNQEYLRWREKNIAQLFAGIRRTGDYPAFLEEHLPGGVGLLSKLYDKSEKNLERLMGVQFRRLDTRLRLGRWTDEGRLLLEKLLHAVSRAGREEPEHAERFLDGVYGSFYEASIAWNTHLARRPSREVLGPPPSEPVGYFLHHLYLWRQIKVAEVTGGEVNAMEPLRRPLLERFLALCPVDRHEIIRDKTFGDLLALLVKLGESADAVALAEREFPAILDRGTQGSMSCLGWAFATLQGLPEPWTLPVPLLERCARGYLELRRRHGDGNHPEDREKDLKYVNLLLERARRLESSAGHPPPPSG